MWRIRCITRQREDGVTADTTASILAKVCSEMKYQQLQQLRLTDHLVGSGAGAKYASYFQLERTRNTQNFIHRATAVQFERKQIHN